MSEDSGTGGTAARRAFLAGAGIAGVVAAFTGCGTAKSNTSDQKHPSDTRLGGSAPASPTAAASSVAAATNSSTGTGSSAATGEDLGPASGVPVGGGKIFDQQRVVVTQPVAGQFKAFSAVCPHSGCLVSAVSDGVIKCRCHGSLFSATDGSVEAGPARKPLQARTVALQGDDLVLQ